MGNKHMENRQCPACMYIQMDSVISFCRKSEICCMVLNLSLSDMTQIREIKRFFLSVGP